MNRSTTLLTRLRAATALAQQLALALDAVEGTLQPQSAWTAEARAASSDLHQALTTVVNHALAEAK